MDYMTWIEINKTALEQNIIQYQRWLPQKTKVAPVIKANAYGHGLIEIGKLHQKNNSISRICVANSQEAVDLRNHGITKPILVMGFLNTPLETIAEYDLDCTVFSIKTLQDYQNIGRLFNKKINIHLKVDTGLSRLGFLPKEVSTALDTIKYSPNLHLQGIWSHLIESSDAELIHEQEEKLKPFWLPNKEIHIARTSSCLLTKYTYDFARIGAGLFGYIPEAELEKQKMLHPIISIKTRIFSIKKIAIGSSVGYGKNTYITSKETMVATLAIGYHEGLDPEKLAHGKFLVHGQYAPIVGRINMNYCMIDVTHIPQAQVNDIVTILGQDGDKYITPYDWQTDTQKNVRIFLARFNNSVPRVITEQPIITMLDSVVKNSELVL